MEEMDPKIARDALENIRNTILKDSETSVGGDIYVSSALAIEVRQTD